MPVTGRGRGMPDLASVLQHLPKDLLGDEDEKHGVGASANSLTSPTRNTFIQVGQSDDQFPILLRSDRSNSVQLSNIPTSGSQPSENSTALDLAQTTPTDTESTWTTFGHHQRSQQSLPMNSMRPMSQQFDSYGSTQIGSGAQTPTKTTGANRHSMGATYNSYSELKRPGAFPTSSNQTSTPTPPKLQSSYSTNDIPTMKNVGSMNGSLTSPTAGPKTHAEQHFQNHNASIGRIPPGAVNRNSRDLSGGDFRADEPAAGFRALPSTLQANAAPFGPTMASAVGEADDQQQTTSGAPVSPTFGGFQNQQQQMYGGYNVPIMPGMSPLNLGTQQNWQNSMPVYQPPLGMYQQYGQFNQQPRASDSQARVIQARRAQNGEGELWSDAAGDFPANSATDQARFTNIELEQIKGEIYSLCKDQHGCRFLQKQLEDRNPERIQMIFAETSDHVVELMTGEYSSALFGFENL